MDDRAANNVLNRLDPPKDAMDGRFLTDSVHGSYIYARLNELFPPEEGPIVGVGDTKPIMINKILNHISPDIIQNGQQLLRLEFSPNGVDQRYAGGFISHDAGLGPSKLFNKNYTLVLTPGSILDPAAKIKPEGVSSNTASIEQENLFSAEEIEAISMDTAFGNQPIEFRPGTPDIPYTFRIPNIGDVTFNTKYTATGPLAQFFAGNPTKNRFIANAIQYDTPAKRIQVKQYLLAKEIGDTLQVCWLKTLLNSNMKSPNMSTENTAIMSNDKVVWLRALLNKVSVYHSYGEVVSFYSADNSPAAIANSIARMKQNTLTELARNNAGVIRVFDDMIGEDSDAVFEGVPFIGANRKQQQFIRVIQLLRESLLQHQRDIIAMFTQLPIDITYDTYRNIATKYHFFSPIVTKNGQYKAIRAFKGFLPLITPNDFIGSKLLFNPQHLYAILASGRSDTAINNMLQNIIHPRMLVMGGGVRSKEMVKRNRRFADKQNDERIYRKNFRPTKPTNSIVVHPRWAPVKFLGNITRNTDFTQSLDITTSANSNMPLRPPWAPEVEWPAGMVAMLHTYVSNPTNLPNIEPFEPATPINPNPYPKGEYEYIQSLWNEENISQPGFVTSHMITHFPEILHLGHAIYRGRNLDHHVAFGPINLFSNELIAPITDSFTNLADTVFTNYIPPENHAEFNKVDNYVVTLCKLALPMITAFIGEDNNQYRIAAEAAANLRSDKISEPTIDEMMHAWGEYQTIYHAEVITTRLNIRDSVDPYRVLQFIDRLTPPPLLDTYPVPGVHKGYNTEYESEEEKEEFDGYNTNTIYPPWNKMGKTGGGAGGLPMVYPIGRSPMGYTGGGAGGGLPLYPTGYNPMSPPRLGGGARRSRKRKYKKTRKAGKTTVAARRRRTIRRRK